MQGPTDETSVPKKYVFDRRLVGVTMRRKNGIRTYPWPAAAENPALPPLPTPPPLEDEGLPPAKKSRRQEPTSFSTTSNVLTTDPTDETPTDPATPATSLPSAAASRAPRHNWKGEEYAKLMEAVKEHGKHWNAVAKLVPGRTNVQCRQRWINTLDPANEIKGKWKPAENAKLLEAGENHGNHGVVAAALVPGRTDGQCRQRWSQTWILPMGTRVMETRRRQSWWKRLRNMAISGPQLRNLEHSAGRTQRRQCRSA